MPQAHGLAEGSGPGRQPCGRRIAAGPRSRSQVAEDHSGSVRFARSTRERCAFLGPPLDLLEPAAQDLLRSLRALAGALMGRLLASRPGAWHCRRPAAAAGPRSRSQRPEPAPGVGAVDQSPATPRPGIPARRCVQSPSPGRLRRPRGGLHTAPFAPPSRPAVGSLTPPRQRRGQSVAPPECRAAHPPRSSDSPSPPRKEIAEDTLAARSASRAPPANAARSWVRAVHAIGRSAEPAARVALPCPAAVNDSTRISGQPLTCVFSVF